MKYQEGYDEIDWGHPRLAKPDRFFDIPVKIPVNGGTDYKLIFIRTPIAGSEPTDEERIFANNIRSAIYEGLGMA